MADALTDIDDPFLLALSARLGERLAARGLLLATAESCTGGWISAAVTAIAGSSGWFDRAFVTYSNRAKIEMLGVGAEIIREHGAVSEPTVRAMVQGALARSPAGIAVAVSGIAGPGGGTADKPVGTVCFAWATREQAGAARVATLVLPGDRQAVRHATVRTALEGLIALL